MTVLANAGAASGSEGTRRRAVPVAIAIVAASLPMFMATLDNLVMTSALPVIEKDLNASVSQLQWFMNAYTLAFATLMLSATTLGDRWGRRRMFVGGIGLFTAASIASALSTSAGLLIAARAVQGVGAAAIMPLSLTLLVAAVPEAKRAMAIGVWGGVSGLGIAMGPVVGGAVVDGFSWQGIFWINVPVAIVAVPLALYALGESTGRKQPLDVAGVALAGLGVFLAVWGIVHGNDDGWGSFGVVASLVGAVIALGLFIVRERTTSHPVMPLRLFRSRSFSMANVIGLTFSIGIFGAVFLLSQYLQIAMGFTPFEAGLRTLPWTAAPMVFAPLAGFLAPKVGLRPLLLTGLGLQAGALFWLAARIVPDATYASLVPALLMAGIGMGLTFAPNATAVLVDMDAPDHGTASSTNATLREIGVALGIAVLTAVFLAAGGALTPLGYSEALTPALRVGGCFVLVAVVAAWFVPSRK
ncbi:DHA2 family efflux MFS transporter permease subunit [Rhodococcus sp. KBS0724]|jgi:EmrB/QacA subfamily drug resistance transporter|uniref:DHA2 family efflux MFS transporter permease subunit n=1 Tax=Rhodococcus sp. KBS0724 TaxID=1179674 RepID=UPI00110F18F6|nr:DHA2 family efflux MFS transporter permease subunit [Rhodococcus sp. KBS0724]TSD46793.1 DHA2 family efflux MFS transporter permease subunit [Rhodococcus sp. KBS0724]